MSDLEVLVGKLLAVDRLTTSSLYQSQFSDPQLIPFSFLFVSFVVFGHEGVDSTHIATSEVTALKHELGNDTVERGALVGQDLAGIICEALAQLGEVLGSSGDNVVVELEVDTTLLGWGEVSVQSQSKPRMEYAIDIVATTQATNPEDRGIGCRASKA